MLVDVEMGDRPGLLDAAACINRALIKRYTDDPSLLARTQLNFSILCNQWSTGDVEAMLREGGDAALAAMEFYRRDEFPHDWAKAAGTLANNYSSRLTGPRSDNLRRAVELYEGALEVRTRVDDLVGYVELRSNLAVAHLVGGSTASVRRALPLLEDAREFHRNAGMQQQWLNDTCSLARALALTSGRQEIERAVGLLREALATADRDTEPKTWIGVASQLAATLEGLDETLQQAEHREEAASVLEQAFELAVAAQWDRTIRLCGGQLGAIRLALGDVAGAAAAFDEATAASDRIWAAQTDSSTRIAERIGDEDLFLHAASAHVVEGRPVEAIYAIERLRARELLARRAPAATGVPVPSVEAVRDVVRPSVAALYVWAIHDRSFAVLVLDGEDQPFDCALSSTDAIRVPAIGAHWGRALVRGRQAPAADAPAVVGGRGGITVQGAPGTMPDFEQLRPALDELTSPWISLIADRDIRLLNVVACGPLANLPWALLPGVDGQPLVMSVDLASPPSLSWAASSPLPGPDKAGTVVVADTDPARPLPYASVEADHIARHTGGKRLHGQDATVAGVLRSLASARVLHLACHGAPEVASVSAPPGTALTEADIATLPADDFELGGLLEARYRRPEAVSVALAGGDRLRPEDVTSSGCVAGTAVVVLAGCDTALLARQRLSDDPFGLPPAFLAAGAQGVIAAMWPVDDAATALAMVDLHEHLTAGHHPPAALGRAQRWLANATAAELRAYVQARPDLASVAWPRLNEVGEDERPYHHPQFWAAFVYIG